MLCNRRYSLIIVRYFMNNRKMKAVWMEKHTTHVHSAENGYIYKDITYDATKIREGSIKTSYFLVSQPWCQGQN